MKRLAARDRSKAIWSEPQCRVAREGFDPERSTILSLAPLPAPRVLREHAIDSMKRPRRP